MYYLNKLQGRLVLLIKLLLNTLGDLSICIRNAAKIKTDNGGSVDVTDTSHQGTTGRGLLSFLSEVLYIISVNGDKNITVAYHHTVYNNSPEENMWDYYFEPVINDKSVKKIYRYFFVTKAYKNSRSDQKEKYRKLFHSILNDRIIIKKEIVDKVDKFFNQYLKGAKCLGVHYRGGADALKYIPANPYFIKCPLAGYFERIDVLLSRGFTKIFLATDDPKALAEFERRYAGKIVSYSTHQRDIVNGIRYITARDRRILGEEVLIDCLLLSRCDYLVHGASNIPVAAKFMNLSLNGDNLDLKKQPFLREVLFKFLSV